MAWKDGQCTIHATCIDEVEELFKVVDDCVDNSKKGTINKEELIERLSEVLPSGCEISFATVTWWNGNGTFNWDTDSDTEPVRHGKWIDIDEQSYTWKIRCSCCGHERSMLSTQGEYPKYCEGCGARMDEE